MALVIRGKSTCFICGRIMGKADEIVIFPPFVPNLRSPIRPFSDAGVHRECLDNHPLGTAAGALLKTCLDQSGHERRRCLVCKEPILEPDDYFSTGLLVADSADPLFDFNFLQFHKSHFALWERSHEFRREVEAFQGSIRWEGARIAFDPLPHWIHRTP